MTEVVVIPEGEHTEPDGDEAPAPPPVEAVEAAADATVEVTETEADAAVTIAAINADRDVEIAQIHAGSAEDAAAVRAEIEECRSQIAGLNQSNIVLAEKLEAALTRLSMMDPPPNPTEIGTVEGDVEVTPVSPEGQEGPTPEPAPRRMKGVRWI
jgi:seryl-tRNA synthetase